MSFDWWEYLELAKYLSGKHDTIFSQEASYRSAVSRAYYSAFCLARNYAKDCLGFQPTGKGEDHERLRQYFKKEKMPDIASALGRLRKWRNVCDYKDQMEGLSKKVQESISFADKIIKRCKRGESK
ncbi:HEPN domain-containing protein [Methylacidiphilum caldifontis]|uniref:Uncharacterized protein n=1 Tax=Methylacidiphilum caldifontis TaxID=2795386 RepID=A0A4Y8PH00_9BACT|nr:HEPN domain-containing protein [Methylacidiphilum caldifontis]TFE71357.1 hypothetical protein A7Q10_04945 [Methylacidiphilum caldifontis]